MPSFRLSSWLLLLLGLVFLNLSFGSLGCPSPSSSEAPLEPQGREEVAEVVTESRPPEEVGGERSQEVAQDATESRPPEAEKTAESVEPPESAEPSKESDEDAMTEARRESPNDGLLQGLSSYVALGSSSTQGAGASDPLKTAYVPLLTERLRALYPALQSLNLGAGGARVSSFLQQLPKIQQAAPQIVTILPFSDYAFTPLANFEAEYTKLFDALQTFQVTVFFGDLRVDPKLVCGRGKGPTGLCYDPADEKAVLEKNQSLVKFAQTYPFLRIVPIMDQVVAQPSWNANDGHPNDRGHLYLADTFWAAIDLWLHQTP